MHGYNYKYRFFSDVGSGNGVRSEIGSKADLSNQIICAYVHKFMLMNKS